VQAAKRIPNKATNDATRRETKHTFGEFTKLFLHVRHRIPLRQRLLLLLLLRSITAVD
jgi:hypothetical protein